MGRSLTVVPLFAVVLAACAPLAPQPSEPHAQSRPAALGIPAGFIADQVRLFQVSYPLLRAASDLCKQRRTYGMGLYALNRFSMGAYTNVAWRYGIGDEMKVLAAVPDGPAYRAGLTAGDIVLSVNGEPAPTTATATRVFGLKMAQIARTGGPVAVSVMRGDRKLTVTVHPELLCGYQVQVAEIPQVNARTDGRLSIYVTRGMLNFAHTDDELALVIAHEIAHDAMGHLDARATLMRSMASSKHTAPGTTAAGVAPAFSQALEMEADHVGLYIVARAGMPVEGAPAFVQRLDASLPTGIQARTHPASKARVAALNRAVQEIERKRAAGLPLTP